MFYRVQQFLRAAFPRINPSEIKWALDHLSPKGSELFLQQSPSDQRHAIDVSKSLIQAKHSLTLDDLENLTTAALLHDCGKSIVYIRLWHRVYIVLIKKLPHFFRSRLEKGHSVFALPIKIDARHALWGKYLAQNAELNSRVCLLIREHHAPTTYLGRLLEQADNKH